MRAKRSISGGEAWERVETLDVAVPRTLIFCRLMKLLNRSMIIPAWTKLSETADVYMPMMMKMGR